MTIPAAFFEGIQQLNDQDFYPCHDTLEALWFEAIEPEKSLYQGILQIAVGCYHLGNHNLRGATILVGEGLRRLRDSDEDEYGGFDLKDFIGQGETFLTKLQYLDPVDVPEVAKDLMETSTFPKLQKVATT